MLRSIREMTGYRIDALDGDVGKAVDYFFDDVGWFVRYVVVDTGNWLSSRRVLVSPEAFGEAEWTKRLIPVRLSRQTIEDSPPVTADEAVHRRNERALRAHYGWPNWWSAPMHGMLAPAAEEVAEAVRQESAVATEDPPGDPHLRSTEEVIGYHIDARDGEIGHVEDFVVDDRTWALRYLVVDTRNLLPGKKVLVSPQWIGRIRWNERKVPVDLARQEIKDAPGFDPEEPINREQEIRLYDFYGRPKYWA